MKEPSETVCDRLEAEYGEYPIIPPHNKRLETRRLRRITDDTQVDP